MHLQKFLARKGAPSVSELRLRMNELGADIQHDAQVRQWAKGKRIPNPANCLYLERATNGAVRRQHMRPTDYAAIWPELSEQTASA
jgi:hypothetical protein